MRTTSFAYSLAVLLLLPGCPGTASPPHKPAGCIGANCMGFAAARKNVVDTGFCEVEAKVDVGDNYPPVSSNVDGELHAFSRTMQFELSRLESRGPDPVAVKDFFEILEREGRRIPTPVLRAIIDALASPAVGSCQVKRAEYFQLFTATARHALRSIESERLAAIQLRLESTPPGATVRIRKVINKDIVFAGVTNVGTYPVYRGEYLLEIRKDGYKTVNDQLPLMRLTTGLVQCQLVKSSAPGAPLPCNKF